MPNYLQALRPVLIPLDIILIAALCVWCASAPSGLDELTGWVCTVVFAVYLVLLLIAPKRIRPDIAVFLSVELCFSLFYFIIFYLPYVKDLIGAGHYWASMMVAQTFPQNANKALLLSSAGYIAFHLGTQLAGRYPDPRFIQPQEEPENPDLYRRFDWFLLCFLGGIITFILGTGMKAADTDRYVSTHAEAVAAAAAGTNSMADNLYTLTILLCIIAVSRLVCTMGQRQRLTPALLLLGALVGIWSLRSIAAGDRNNFLLIALAASSGFAAFVRQIRWPLVVMAAAGALLLYQVVEISRSMQADSDNDLITAVEKSTEDTGQEDNGSFNNTTITLRAMFDIVPAHQPYAMGYYKLIGFGSVLPFVRGLVISPKNQFTGTSGPLTFYILGPGALWSTGTNLLSDIYMDFGMAGVPILIACVSFITTRSRFAIIRRGLTSKRAFIYVVLVANVSEMPRYTLDFPVRMVTWGLIMFLLYEFVFVGSRRAAAPAEPLPGATPA